ncbi:MAG: 3-phosphoshikimate 1-carboxyvinyltransferase, partial [bacterium]
MFKVHHPTGVLKGKIVLSGSKSISNRVLIIKGLCSNHFPVSNLSDSDDTHSLAALLQSDADVL